MTAASAIAYIRVSTDRQELGPEAQRDAIERYAATHGLTIAAWFEDRGVSGAAPLDERPGLLAALAALRTRRAAVLLVGKRDRLARDQVTAALVDRMVERDGARIDSADGAGNATGPEGALMRGMLDTFAAFERSQIRARTKAALAAKRARGERVGGVPYGSRVASDGVRLEVDSVEQEIIDRMRAMRTTGATLQAITDALNANRVPARGARWHLTTVAVVLRRG